MTRVPLPGDTVVNISVDYSYLRPVRVGDRLRMVEELIDVSPEKTTRLGTGHFVTTSATFSVPAGAAADEVVATQTNVLFRYRSGAGDA
jgi:acyl dehydratase